MDHSLSKLKLTSDTPTGSATDVSSTERLKGPDGSTALQRLQSLIPDLINMILSIYNRAANFAGEALPQLAFSQFVIRVSKLLTVMNKTGGALTHEALQRLVQGIPMPVDEGLSFARPLVVPSKNEISATLFRALPSPAEASAVSNNDLVLILAGIASVFAELEVQRKKAMILKLLVDALIPSLVQARKVGAAEMGLHPAAGLAALNMSTGGSNKDDSNPDSEVSIAALLMSIAQTYGLSRRRHATSASTEAHPSDGIPQDPQEALFKAQILQDSARRSFGSLHLKLDTLRTCINLCEALPDFKSILQFTADILAVAGPGFAPAPNSSDVFVVMSREEQVRLATNISRTSDAADKLGMNDVDADYWDEFLVRGVHIVDAPQARLLTQHQKSDLEKAKSAVQKTKGPFLHDPFAKQAQVTAAEKFIVAGEDYEFLVTLQNPYDFEVEIERLALASEGVQLEAWEQHLVLGPYRNQRFMVWGVARGQGSLTVTGCYVKVRGCKNRFFPILEQPWRPGIVIKSKDIGLQALHSKDKGRPLSGASTSSQRKEAQDAISPSLTTLPLTVIAEQPVVEIIYTSLPQGALMVLEGEKKLFRITVQNTSNKNPINFLHMSFQDPLTAGMQEALRDKQRTPSELHELEMHLSSLPTMTFKPLDEAASASLIEPGRTASFEITVYGKPGLTAGSIYLDYAHLDKPQAEIEARFFTRQVSLSFNITVNASIQLANVNLSPFTSDFAWSNQQQRKGRRQSNSPTTPRLPASGDDRFKGLLSRIGISSQASDHCLMILDLRNAWPSPLSISIELLDSDVDGEAPARRVYTVHEVIHPGHTNRVILILPKIHIQYPHAAIPSLNPANQRQFVVSATKQDPAAERTTREQFWYREELLRRLRGTWRDEGSGREGEVQLRNLRLPARGIELLGLDDVGIDMSIGGEEQDDSDVQQVGRTKFAVPTDTFLTLRATVHNRSPAPIHAILRLQPSLSKMSPSVALDLDKRLCWSGLLQNPLSILGPGETATVEIGLCALSKGIFEVGALVEEIRPSKDLVKSEGGGRGRSATGGLFEGFVEDVGRRTWHAGSPCLIIARE